MPVTFPLNVAQRSRRSGAEIHGIRGDTFAVPAPLMVKRDARRFLVSFRALAAFGHAS